MQLRKIALIIIVYVICFWMAIYRKRPFCEYWILQLLQMYVLCQCLITIHFNRKGKMFFLRKIIDTIKIVCNFSINLEVICFNFNQMIRKRKRNRHAKPKYRNSNYFSSRKHKIHKTQQNNWTFYWMCMHLSSQLE